MEKLLRDTIPPKFLLLIGFIVFVIGIILLAYTYNEASLVVLSTAMSCLFYGSIRLEYEQIRKGSTMIFIGAIYSAVIAFTIGLERYSGNTGTIVTADVSNMLPMFYLLVVISAAVFSGTGGSLIANHAATLSTDYPVSKTEISGIRLTKIRNDIENTNFNICLFGTITTFLLLIVIVLLVVIICSII